MTDPLKQPRTDPRIERLREVREELVDIQAGELGTMDWTLGVAIEHVDDAIDRILRGDA